MFISDDLFLGAFSALTGRSHVYTTGWRINHGGGWHECWCVMGRSIWSWTQVSLDPVLAPLGGFSMVTASSMHVPLRAPVPRSPLFLSPSSSTLLSSSPAPVTLFLSRPQEPVWPQKWIGTTHYYRLFRRKWELSLPQGRLQGQFSAP